MPAPEIRDARPADAPFLVDCNAAMAAETEGRELSRDVLAQGVAGVFDRSARHQRLDRDLARQHWGNATNVTKCKYKMGVNWG
jgi:hypothetical protein